MDKIHCMWCGQITAIVWVHGHGQCSFCGINIDECCRGEQCKTETSTSIPVIDKNLNDISHNPNE